MKKLLSTMTLVLLVCVALTSCSFEAPPEIEEGRFNFSITLDMMGETKIFAGTYVCKYAGYDFNLEGGDFVRTWDSHVEGIEHADEIFNNAVLIYETDDGGEIFLSFGLVAPYMMGEPDFADSEMEPSLFLVYSNEDHTTSEHGGWDEEVEALYGIKVVDYQYDAPIVNSFGRAK